ncbi:MAG: asparagine synthase (glutamine-hydrolyzing) [Candidatus Omnitrophica bacterium]|nr:asparagine synthase (glutamine-hydrolyzing) [Candidatus Omnitrophota bacterium]
MQKPSGIIAMTTAMRHRGPDDEGYLAVDLNGCRADLLAGNDTKRSCPMICDHKGRVDMYLGHRRLSILDLSTAGHQPMSNHDGSLWIVYNGEIYNYLELREELSGSGYSFRSETDTEVIIAAYERWGSGCLDRFNGMWSFVIFDSRKRGLFGARDRFGVKPFYYYINNKVFAFASEIKALLKLPFMERRINREAAFDYLVMNREEVSEETMFKGIFELPPAHYFEFDLKASNFRKHRYFDLECAAGWEDVRPEKMEAYVGNVREMTKKAVRMRLRSDVPVGTCLSGGIDSSSIASIINDLLRKEDIRSVGNSHNTFTACYRHAMIDESKWARLVGDVSGSKWHRVYPDAEGLKRDIEDMVYTQDTPFGSTSIYAQYCVMRLAAEAKITVLLDGQGGDELFGGYTNYYRPFFAEIIRNFRVGRFLRELLNMGNSPLGMDELISSGLFRILSKAIPIRLVARSGRNTSLGYFEKDFNDEYKYKWDEERSDHYGSLNKVLRYHMAEVGLKSLLRYEDRNSMRFSIEARTPFADDIDLIRYVFSISSGYKIRNGWSKYLLRAGMSGILQESIRWRKDKIGFATPEYEWLILLKERLRSYITEELDEYCDVKAIKNDWDNIMLTQDKTRLREVWRIIFFAIWKKVFNL